MHLVLSKVTGKPVDGWERGGGAKAYRCLLYSNGVEVRDGANQKVVKVGVLAETARAVLKEGGKLSAGELTQLRVRYFTDGLVLGTREFVEEMFVENRGEFGPKGKDGARKIAETSSGLYALRRLRRQAVS